MNIVLVSTYELGRQPFGLASPAAWLRARSHRVACCDVSREPFAEPAIRDADLIAFYVPMHTATRLAIELIAQARRLNPRAHLCFYGLYAPVNEGYLRSLGVGTVLGGEFEQGLVDLAARLSLGDLPQPEPPQKEPPRQEPPQREPPRKEPPRKEPPEKEPPRGDPPQPEPVISLARQKFLAPDRAGLPQLAKYARVILPDGERLIAGSTEATRGCKHLCRHCPIVPVYNGAFRVIEREVVLDDIRQQVAAGAQHITFGDPDFFNGPTHGLSIVEAMHGEFPRLSYDVTIKIEHLRKHDALLRGLRDTGCLFVTSAVESVDDRVLEKFDKGHTRADFLAVAARFREIGLTLLPTFVPFTPWTTPENYRDLLTVIAEQGLIENVAPIQLAIRLLIPAGSRLLELAEVREMVGPFDSAALVYPWRHADPTVELLGQQVLALAQRGDKKESRGETFAQIWQAAQGEPGAGLAVPPRFAAQAEANGVPYLDEPWYCCAEPQREQFLSIANAGASACKPQPLVNAEQFL